jgi:hypothetical protein
VAFVELLAEFCSAVWVPCFLVTFLSCLLLPDRPRMGSGGRRVEGGKQIFHDPHPLCSGVDYLTSRSDAKFLEFSLPSPS